MVASHWHDLISYESRVLGLAPGECEVLYGRSGYLQAVLLASRAAAGARVEVDGRGLCERVVAQIFEEGLRCASLIRDESGGHLDFPLCWKWHDKVYLGAAHGLAGILYTLMLYREQLQLVSADRGLDLVIETIVYVVDNLSHPSGNLYSSARMRDPEDRLVQWCHGAPGLVHLLCLAAETFPHRTEWCLQRAEIACECVWERGLLKKGLGLCHGISGNAYCFVAIARALIKQANFSEGRGDFETAMSHRTKAEMYMLRAHTYAEFMIENFSALKDVPDNPYSLFE
ncbi:Lancl2, partial [Symbiodinium microadriaticum]